MPVNEIISSSVRYHSILQNPQYHFVSDKVLRGSVSFFGEGNRFLDTEDPLFSVVGLVFIVEHSSELNLEFDPIRRLFLVIRIHVALSSRINRTCGKK